MLEHPPDLSFGNASARQLRKRVLPIERRCRRLRARRRFSAEQLAKEEELVRVPGRRRMAVSQLVVDGEDLRRTDEVAGFLPHFARRRDAGRFAYVAPAARQGPAAVAPLLYEEDLALAEDSGAHVHLRRRIAFLHGEVHEGLVRGSAAVREDLGRDSPHFLPSLAVERILDEGEAVLGKRRKALRAKEPRRRSHRRSIGSRSRDRSPDRVHDAATLDTLVLAHERRPERQRARDDHPIGGIAGKVVAEKPRACRYRRRERDHLDSRKRERKLDPFDDVVIEPDTSSSRQHRDFEAGDRRDTDTVGRVDRAPRRRRQAGALAIPPPQPRMCVENNHLSTSQSPPIGPTMSPRTLHNGSLALLTRSGITRATGLPRLVMTIGSPVSATSSRSLRHRVLKREAATRFMVIS